LSQNSLGTLHVENEDYDEAEEYYQYAANQGHALAQYNTGMMYEPDFEMSRPHFERAAAQGHASALFSLGNLYANSDVSQDYEYARYYYQEASRQGHALAESELARLQSRRNERHYYRLATEYGHNEGKSDLALLRTYKQREGMPRVSLAPNTVAQNHDNLQENKSDVVAENAAYYFYYCPFSSSLERCVDMFDPYSRNESS
jgi:TPR repeat protein